MSMGISLTVFRQAHARTHRIAANALWPLLGGARIHGGVVQDDFI